MPVTASISIMDLILHASWFVKLIMLGLAGFSMYSWYVIVQKTLALKAVQLASTQFEDLFWTGAELNALQQKVSQHEAQGVAKVFQSGFAEMVKHHQRQTHIDSAAPLEAARRAMNVANQREIERLESGLAALGTIGSVSPYIGLLGTVWGIMNSFIGIGQTGQASLATVAPGIAEALIATAIGLFAAIPAVMAYNRFAHQIDRVAMRMDNFTEEFSNILQRQTAATQGNAK